jgi:hypothetical protein
VAREPDDDSVGCMTENPTTWVTELKDLLTRAAELSKKNGVASDAFMNAAWNAVLDADPKLREKLIDKELKAQLKKLRRQGLMPQA